MKIFGKILLWSLSAALGAAIIIAAAAGIKYYRVRHSDAKVELISGPARKPGPPSLGEKLRFQTVFRLPWGVRPLSMTVQPAPGCQLAGQAVFIRLKRGWGCDLWESRIPLQCYREGDIKESSAQAVFSNRQTVDLKLPSMQVQPPLNIQGDQLELAGPLESVRKNAGRYWMLWLFAGLLVLAAVILIVLKFMKRDRTRILSPWEKALSAIQSLLDKVRAGAAAPERSIALLTDIVREYMERRFLLRAEHQTTAEFMADLEGGKGNLDSRHRDFLRSFLTAADMVKFAKVPADKTLFENAALKAEELIRETAPGETGKEDKK